MNTAAPASPPAELPCAAEPYLPHAAPMALVERIVSHDARRVVGESTVRADNPFVDEAGLPAWVGVEYMAQTVAAHAGLQAAADGRAPRRGVLIGTRRMHWDRPAYPVGTCLRLHAEHVAGGDTGLLSFDCEIRIDEAVVSQCRINVFQPDDAEQFLSAGR